MLIRLANILAAIAFGLGVMVCLAFLPSTIESSAREPEDVRLLGFWLIYCVMLGGLCIANALAGHRRAGERRPVLLIMNTVASLVSFLMLIIGFSDPSVVLVVGASLFGPWAWLLGFTWPRRSPV